MCFVSVLWLIDVRRSEERKDCAFFHCFLFWLKRFRQFFCHTLAATTLIERCEKGKNHSFLERLSAHTHQALDRRRRKRLSLFECVGRTVDRVWCAHNNLERPKTILHALRILIRLTLMNNPVVASPWIIQFFWSHRRPIDWFEFQFNCMSYREFRFDVRMHWHRFIVY